jgi:hypothetical protein
VLDSPVEGRVHRVYEWAHRFLFPIVIALCNDSIEEHIAVKEESWNPAEAARRPRSIQAPRTCHEEAKAAGVYVFGGGIEENVDPVLVSADGSVSTEIYPGTEITGGFTVLELPNRQAAEEWARMIAASCRCSQELREFGFDPQS